MTFLCLIPSNVIVDNMAYARTVKVPSFFFSFFFLFVFWLISAVADGFPHKRRNADLSTVLPEEIESEVKEAADISMGTEVTLFMSLPACDLILVLLFQISDEDLTNITYLADQVISISEYRAELFEYLKNRFAFLLHHLTHSLTRFDCCDFVLTFT